MKIFKGPAPVPDWGEPEFERESLDKSEPPETCPLCIPPPVQCPACGHTLGRLWEDRRPPCHNCGAIVGVTR